MDEENMKDISICTLVPRKSDAILPLHRCTQMESLSFV